MSLASTLLAGAAQPGCADGCDTSAQFSHPRGLVSDGGNDRIVVADSHNHCIRAIDHFGTVVTLAGRPNLPGHTDGCAGEAQFWYPSGCAMDQKRIIVADSRNNCIRCIESDGTVVTIAGTTQPGLVNGAASTAAFSNPEDVAVGNEHVLYVADTENNVVRKIDMNSGCVTTLCGTSAAGHQDGAAGQVCFNRPRGIAVDAEGFVIVADTNNHCIRRISPSGLCVTVAGSPERGFADGETASAKFSFPTSVSVDKEGRYLVADTGNNRLRFVTAQGVVTSIVGSGVAGYAEGSGADAILHSPSGVASCSSGGYVFADSWNHRVRFVNDPIQASVGPFNAASDEHTCSEELSPAGHLAIRILEKEINMQMQINKGLRDSQMVYELELRRTHDEATKALEKQRRELEASFAQRSRQLEAEIAMRKSQCDRECQAMVDAQREKVHVVLKALESLNPDQLLADAHGQNELLRSEIAALREELEKRQHAAQKAESNAQSTGLASTLNTFFQWDNTLARAKGEPVCKPGEPVVNPAQVMRELQIKKQTQELELAKQKAIRVEDFIYADELKEQIRKLNGKLSSPVSRLSVTITNLRVKDEHITDFSSSWQEPPRTRLLQSTEDPANFIMYEAHPTQKDAQKIMETSDLVKWGDVAAWLKEPSATSTFDAIHMLQHY